ncbi:MAG TPA: hypothetical protein VFW59_09170, partial [Gallionella sp.]|nr:hypothetical protein [Gallionella sp.]
NSEHDCESRAQNIKVACDLLVLWGKRGVVSKLFKPLELWQAQCAGRDHGTRAAGRTFHPGGIATTHCGGTA